MAVIWVCTSYKIWTCGNYCDSSEQSEWTARFNHRHVKLTVVYMSMASRQQTAVKTCWVRASNKNDVVSKFSLDSMLPCKVLLVSNTVLSVRLTVYAFWLVGLEVHQPIKKQFRPFRPIDQWDLEPQEIDQSKLITLSEWLLWKLLNQLEGIKCHWNNQLKLGCFVEANHLEESEEESW